METTKLNLNTVPVTNGKATKGGNSLKSKLSSQLSQLIGYEISVYSAENIVAETLEKGEPVLNLSLGIKSETFRIYNIRKFINHPLESKYEAVPTATVAYNSGIEIYENYQASDMKEIKTIHGKLTEVFK